MNSMPVLPLCSYVDVSGTMVKVDKVATISARTSVLFSWSVKSHTKERAFPTEGFE